MVLAGQLPVRLLDLLAARAPSNPERVVEVGRHRGSIRPRPADDNSPRPQLVSGRSVPGPNHPGHGVGFGVAHPRRPRRPRGGWGRTGPRSPHRADSPAQRGFAQPGPGWRARPARWPPGRPRRGRGPVPDCRALEANWQRPGRARPHAPSGARPHDASAGCRCRPSPAATDPPVRRGSTPATPRRPQHRAPRKSSIARLLRPRSRGRSHSRPLPFSRHSSHARSKSASITSSSA